MQCRATVAAELGIGGIGVVAEGTLEREHGRHGDGRTTQDTNWSSEKFDIPIPPGSSEKFRVRQNLRNATVPTHGGLNYLVYGYNLLG